MATKYISEGQAFEHTDAAGAYHRIVLIDRGPESVDRYIVKSDGKTVHFGADRDPAITIFDTLVEEIKSQ